MKTTQLLLLSFVSFNLAGQNLVPDPGFEMMQIIPSKETNYIYCTKNWVPPNLTNADYYNIAAKGKHGGVPKNTFGNQEPHSGSGYAGICIQGDFIEYIETKLTSTLIKGENYLIEFYISKAEKALTSVNEFGILFADKVRRGFDIKGIPHKPNVDFTNPSGYKNKDDWIKLSAIYTAEGYEAALILGYFNYDQPKGYSGMTHYYIDDVTVTLVEKKNNSLILTKVVDSIPKLFSPKFGEAVTLKNIFFETNKAELLSQSFSELDKLVQYLNKDSATTIIISGHTDNTGNEHQNKTLSEARAKAVSDYLSSKQIDKIRIKYIGYGSAKPINSNDTDECKQLNRRVEVILNKK
ncbi:MAG: OmpA family protein [Bacteroidetes bacterium]|nr:OmpA family protein [Bacteroidota bacterium]